MQAALQATSTPAPFNTLSLNNLSFVLIVAYIDNCSVSQGGIAAFYMEKLTQGDPKTETYHQIYIHTIHTAITLKGFYLLFDTFGPGSGRPSSALVNTAAS